MIKKIIPNCKIQGNLNPPRSGAFEIKVDGKLIYSKLRTSTFPTKNELDEILL